MDLFKLENQMTDDKVISRQERIYADAMEIDSLSTTLYPIITTTVADSLKIKFFLDVVEVGDNFYEIGKYYELESGTTSVIETPMGRVYFTYDLQKTIQGFEWTLKSQTDILAFTMFISQVVFQDSFYNDELSWLNPNNPNNLLSKITNVKKTRSYVAVEQLEDLLGVNILLIDAIFQNYKKGYKSAELPFTNGMLTDTPFGNEIIDCIIKYTSFHDIIYVELIETKSNENFNLTFSRLIDISSESWIWINDWVSNKEGLTNSFDIDTYNVDDSILEIVLQHATNFNIDSGYIPFKDSTFSDLQGLENTSATGGVFDGYIFYQLSGDNKFTVHLQSVSEKYYWIRTISNDNWLEEWSELIPVVDNLQSTDTQKPLSANMGKRLHDNATFNIVSSFEDNPPLINVTNMKIETNVYSYNVYVEFDVTNDRPVSDGTVLFRFTGKDTSLFEPLYVSLVNIYDGEIDVCKLTKNGNRYTLDNIRDIASGTYFVSFSFIGT